MPKSFRISSLVLCSAILAFAALRLFSPSITVTAPNGGETLEKGTIYNISWTSYKLSSSLLTISLLRGGETIMTIVKSTANTGSYGWKVPASLSDASNYVVKIKVDGKKISDSSDKPFSVVTPRPRLTVLSPNGGETWKKGTVQTIKWKFESADQGTLGSTSIWLSVKDSSGTSINVFKIAELPTSITGENQYSWTVPSKEISDANNYYLLVEAKYSSPSFGNDMPVHDYSDKEFTVYTTDPSAVAPAPPPPPVFTDGSVTVLSPNGGDLFEKGKTYSIKWRVSASNSPSDPVATTIYLDLLDTCGSKLQYYKVASAPLSRIGDNEYQWTVPTGTDIPDAAIYRVTIGVQTGVSYGLASVTYDQSDQNFTVYTTDPNSVPKSFYLTDAYVTVVSPNGGENWLPGKTYTVTWKFFKTQDQFIGPFDTNITLQQRNNDGTERTAYVIAQNQFLTKEGENNYTWTFPDNATAVDGTPLDGINYRVLVQVNKMSYYTDLKGCKVPFDESDKDISLGVSGFGGTGAPALNVIAPNGGESLKAGMETTVSYKISGFASGTPLTFLGELMQNGATLGKITPGVIPITSDSISFAWIAGLHYGYTGTETKNVTGTGFKIHLLIYQNNLLVASDTSDGVFAIVP